jgi:hypothetical protein
MRYLHLDGRHVVFFCEGCGKRLDDADPGDAYWEDYDRFVEEIEAGREAEEPRFLCWGCFKERGGPMKDWYDPNWRILV